MCLISVHDMVLWSDGVKVLISPMDELFVIRLILIPCGLKKSVIFTCFFGLCSMSLCGKQKFLAGGLGSPVSVVVWGHNCTTRSKIQCCCNDHFPHIQ